MQTAEKNRNRRDRPPGKALANIEKQFKYLDKKPRYRHQCPKRVERSERRQF